MAVLTQVAEPIEEVCESCCKRKYHACEGRNKRRCAASADVVRRALAEGAGKELQVHNDDSY
jgi:hypothetical protein